MNLFFRIYKHLLPTGLAWSIVINKLLRRFFLGLSGFGDDIKTFVDLTHNDIYPDTTRRLSDYEEMFGLYSDNLTTVERRNRLNATWKATGGQSPRYIQDTLQNAGFDLYVHEWWVEGTELPVNVTGCLFARDPNTVLRLEGDAGAAFTATAGDTTITAGDPDATAGSFATGGFGYPLVNIIPKTVRTFVATAGDTTITAGDPDATSGSFGTSGFERVEYEIPTDSTCWPYFWYVGAPTYGELASIDGGRRDELERLLLKLGPAHMWIGVLVKYV